MTNTVVQYVIRALWRCEVEFHTLMTDEYRLTSLGGELVASLDTGRGIPRYPTPNPNPGVGR